jgi:hypothetical protein
MSTEFTKAELEAIAEMADWYLVNGGLDINLPADSMGLILVGSIFEKAKSAVGETLKLAESQ